MGQSVLGQELLGVPEAARAVAGLGQQHRGGLVDLPDGLQHAFQVDGAGGGDEQHESAASTAASTRSVCKGGVSISTHSSSAGAATVNRLTTLHPKGSWAAGR